MERFVYADNAATTKITQPVLDAMMPYLTEEYGNPSSPVSYTHLAPPYPRGYHSIHRLPV